MNPLFEIHASDDHAIVYDIDQRRLIVVCPADDDSDGQSVRIPLTARGLTEMVEKLNELRELMR